LVVTANAAGSVDTDGTIASYIFDFGDGTVVGPQAEATATHTYGPGAWVATVWVTDNDSTTSGSYVLVIAKSAQGFHDEFEGASLDTTVWSVHGGDGTIVVANGTATLRCTGSTFPVATTKDDPFPTGDFLVRVGLRYLSVFNCGDGFGAIDNFSGGGCSPFKLWQDTRGLYVYAGSAGYALLSNTPVTDYHVYEWRYVGGQYEFWIDGFMIGLGGQCAPKPTAFFFGHPHPVSCSSWTSFEIDFVHIEPLPTNPLARRLRVGDRVPTGSEERPSLSFSGQF
jgi:hypothetical protein